MQAFTFLVPFYLLPPLSLIQICSNCNYGMKYFHKKKRKGGKNPKLQAHFILLMNEFLVVMLGGLRTIKSWAAAAARLALITLSLQVTTHVTL